MFCTAGRLALIALASVAFIGCRSVHTAREGSVPVALWLPTATQQEGHGARSQDQAILNVLRENGLHPVIDDAGLAVPTDEEQLARQVLLLDKRLIDSGVSVFLAVPAGSARKTASGIELPAAVLAPAQEK
jgi:hypothetical protein